MRWLPLVIVLTACGGSNDGGGVDAPPSPDADDSARCLITGSYGDLGAQTGTTSQGPTTLSITLDAGPPKDSFFLKLVDGNGAFAGGLANGTYSIAGADASFTDCGLCVNIVADISTTTGPAKFYFADSGTVTLTSTSPPVGTLSAVHFVEITIQGTPIIGGCEASIDAMSFSAM
jgi:hypothetical protein